MYGKMRGMTIWMPATLAFSISMIVALTLAGTAMGEMSRNGLVGEWLFDEGSGNIAKDSSGNKNDGIIYGATFVDGKFRKALSFDGDGYVNIGKISQITSNSDWTVAFWMRSAAAENYRNPFDANFVGEGNNQGPRFEQNNLKGFRLYIGTTVENYQSHAYTDALRANTWYHIVAVRSGNSLIGYFDGMQSFYKSCTLCPQSFSNVNIGRGFSTSPERWFIGIVDDVRIYNRALTTEEIKALYNETDIPTLSPSITPLTSPPTPSSTPQNPGIIIYTPIIVAIISGTAIVIAAFIRHKYTRK